MQKACLIKEKAHDFHGLFLCYENNDYANCKSFAQHMFLTFLAFYISEIKSSFFDG